MTVLEVLEQAKALKPSERKELVKLLIDTLYSPPEQQSEGPVEHWGKSLNQLLDTIGPIELMYPEIEDPVEWVEHLRAEQRRHRLGNWGEEGSEGTDE
jgi:hypothetical protein